MFGGWATFGGGAVGGGVVVFVGGMGHEGRSFGIHGVIGGRKWQVGLQKAK